MPVFEEQGFQNMAFAVRWQLSRQNKLVHNVTGNWRKISRIQIQYNNTYPSTSFSIPTESNILLYTHIHYYCVLAFV